MNTPGKGSGEGCEAGPEGGGLERWGRGEGAGVEAGGGWVRGQREGQEPLVQRMGGGPKKPGISL